MHFSHISDETYRKSAVMLFIRHRITEAPGSNFCRFERPSRRQALSGSVSSRLEPHHRCGSSLLSAPGQGGRRQCSRPRIVGQNVPPLPPLSREVTETQTGNRYRTRRWSRLFAKQLPLCAPGHAGSRVRELRAPSSLLMDRQKNARHRVSKNPSKIPKNGTKLPIFWIENLPTFPTPAHPFERKVNIK